jgi:hypothetical protein
MRRCWPQRGYVVDVAGEGVRVDSSDQSVQTNIVWWMLNVTVACEIVVDSACLRRETEALVCYADTVRRHRNDTTTFLDDYRPDGGGVAAASGRVDDGASHLDLNGVGFAGDAAATKPGRERQVAMTAGATVAGTCRNALTRGDMGRCRYSWSMAVVRRTFATTPPRQGDCAALPTCGADG